MPCPIFSNTSSRSEPSLVKKWAALVAQGVLRAESFKSAAHLQQIVDEAKEIVTAVLA